MRICADDTAAVVIDFQEKLVPVISGKEEILRKSAILVQGLAEVGVPFVVSQQYTKGLGETVEELTGVIDSFHYMEKNTFSCFECEEIADWVKAQGKRTILVCGVEAHICVLQTVIDLLGADYRVFVVADCVGSRNPYDKEIGLERMRVEGAILTTCEAALFELTGGAKSPYFKAISKLVK
ncbi:vibriobactin-specific isochorismatase [Anaerotignum neopropionicum]|uniref:Vibriobactin-specific isochorismatase n=1 Tax=Anaerotignum neopropionicum TaxID=36847 RepID=A0A136WEY3_9FIRM|nr:hydrolase [Anaerotignum neopropionicum]KXL53106.1 vibriobactin-specific isochorismatase [Anaerotignum neopropionicum]